jgi:DNA-binding transcriptional ArsR family regulator
MSKDELDLTFHALSDATRRAILARLAEGDATVNELAEPFAISLSAISKHLKVLERAGLITRGRNAQYRPCHLETESLQAAHSWIDDYRVIWEGRFDRLASFLDTLQREDTNSRPPEHPHG